MLQAALTSSSDLNAVWDLCLYTVNATALDMYTDSNTRQVKVELTSEGLFSA